MNCSSIKLPKGLAYILKETKRILQLSYLLSTRIIRMQLWAGGGGYISNSCFYLIVRAIMMMFFINIYQHTYV